MVNTINGKYFQRNSKTDSRSFYKDKWTLIKHLPNEKRNSKSIYRQWIYFDGITDEKLRSWLLANIEGLEYITNNAVIKNSENNNKKVILRDKNFSNFQRQICETKIKEIKRWGKITRSA